MSRQRVKVELANGPTPKIEPQSDECPQVYLSHTVVSTTALETELLKCSGMRYRCFSFVYIVPEAIYWSPRALESYELNVKKQNHIMMDSGAFSFQMFIRRKGKSARELEKSVEKTVDQYVEFCQKRKKEWDFYVTFDWDQKVDLVWKVTKELEERGLRPTPVYHGDQSLSYLKRYLDAGYKRIGISPVAITKRDYKACRRFLENVFRTTESYKVKLHGFALTSLSMMFAFPWTSVDSSSWSRVASYGGIYLLDEEKSSMKAIHVSTTGQIKATTESVTALSPQAFKSLKDRVEDMGWDFELLRRSLQYRFIFNAWTYSHLNQFKDKIEKRYVRWKPLL